MSEQRVRQLLAQLHQELQDTEFEDPETLSMVRQVDADIHHFLEKGEEGSLREGVRALGRFEAEHPTAGAFLHEMIEALARMGI